MTALRLEDVGYRAPGGSFTMNGINFSLEEGEVVGLLGPNGSGKSTLLRLCLGLLPPFRGRIEHFGRDLSGLHPREVARRAAFVPQDFSPIFSMTAREFVALGRFAHGGGVEERQVGEALAAFDLLPWAHHPVRALSGGESRRLLLARAWAQDPRLLFLDEPNTHLDPRHQSEMVRRVERFREEKRAAVLVVLHDLTLAARWCSRIILLKNGGLWASGAPRSVMTNENLQTVYGAPLRAIFEAGSAPRVEVLWEDMVS